jgi:predicted dehydrogenase
MLRIGIAGCGLQAATIAGYLGVYGDDYQTEAVLDTNFEHAKARIAEKNVRLSTNCRFHGRLEDFIADAKNLDGIIIGTPCSLHTDIACALESLGVPLYLEKPVSVTIEQLKKLHKTFKDSQTPVQVSLPMRVCPLADEAAAIIRSGKIGAVEQIAGYNDVTYGDVYFSTWFRDFAKTGGMFMQKAVHDIDYMLYLAGSRPKEVCAMRAQRVFGGDKPWDLSCDKCGETETCPESPRNYFHERGQFDSVASALKYRYGKRMCKFSKGIKIDDVGECVIELESGAHLNYHQNFFVRGAAHRRGARFYGYKGTLQIDFSGKIRVISHRRGVTEDIEVPSGQMSHYGGDQTLVHDFLQTMKTGKRARTDLITGDGIYSTLACLMARESADRREFMKVEF